MKARLLFIGTAAAIGVIGFAVGYRPPESLRTLAAKIGPAPDVLHVSPDRASAGATRIAMPRDNLRVEGFAKIGFAEMEELLTASSPEEREQWAAELGALPISPLKPIALISFYTAWLDLKPDEAIRSLRKFPDLLNRLNVFDAVRAAVSPVLLPQMIELVSELSEVERRVLLPTYLAALAQTDPAATARFIDSHGTLVSGFDAAALMSAWARDDTDAARRWLEGSQFLTDSNVLRSLVDAWSAKDPAAARDFVLAHREDEGIEEAANSIAARLFNTSPEQTRYFITQFDHPRASRILMNLVSSVKDEEVGSLATWAATLPGSMADEGIGYALARWAFLDPGRAIDWLRAKPAAQSESLLIRMIETQAAPVSPEIVALAYKIRDPQKRDGSLSILVRSIMNEADNPTERIRALGLSASQTNHLLGLRPKPSE